MSRERLRVNGSGGRSTERQRVKGVNGTGGKKGICKEEDKRRKKSRNVKTRNGRGRQKKGDRNSSQKYRK